MQHIFVAASAWVDSRCISSGSRLNFDSMRNHQRLAVLSKVLVLTHGFAYCLTLLAGESRTPGHPDRHIVARSEPNWHTIANFVVAVAIDSPVSAIHLPQDQPAGALHKHFFLGDMNGKLHTLSLSGSVLIEHQTDGASPITAISEGKYRCERCVRVMHELCSHMDADRWILAN